MVHSKAIVIFAVFSYLWLPAFASMELKNCLSDLQSGVYGTGMEAGGTDNFGNPVNAANATAIKYRTCVDKCGGGPASFNWSQFSKQFSTWLLPWLALLSQLPFGADDKLDNLLSVVLTIGSPTLAAYSVGLTALNGRWIVRQFSTSSYPNTRVATRVLSSLQQVPLRVYTRGSLLASLVVLPQNDEWWSDLLAWLNYTHTWSISAATSIAWVLIAYFLTIINCFTADLTNSVEVNGQAGGSLWIWLLPVVVAWLQISPKCDSTRVREAMRRANEIAYDASSTTTKMTKWDDGIPVRASHRNELRGIFLRHDGDPLYTDEQCSSPIYNYARIFSWTTAVEEIHSRFEEASRRLRLHQPVDCSREWVYGGRGTNVRAENRQGTAQQVVRYCTDYFARDRDRGGLWGSGVWGRIIVASVFAMFLSWGSVASAVIAVWLTPTRGLGCRSTAYIVYAGVSTIVWALLVASSILSHYSTISSSEFFYDPRERDPHQNPHNHDCRSRISYILSITLRRLGKLLAVWNTFWILAICLFQFTGFFDNCYCNSSALGLGRDKAYFVVIFLDSDVSAMKMAWVGGVCIALGCAAVFSGFVGVLINPEASE